MATVNKDFKVKNNISIVNTADTATAASHYIVETGSDGVIRPKTLANVQSEIVTSTTVNNAITTLPLNKGGTNANLSAINGGIVYSGDSALAITAAGTSGQALVSAGANAPAWTTLTLENLPDAAYKRSVKAATTANITLSGEQTIDGIAVVTGDRVLVKNQTASGTNGIYIASTGAWTRAADADSITEIAGATVNVDQGTQGSQLWSNNLKTTDTLGTTAQTWTRLLNSGDSMFIGTTSVSLTRASAALTLAGITLTTPTIAVINAAASSASTLWSGITTGSIVIGSGLTSGALTLGATAQTGTITVGRSTGAQTLDLAVGATANATTKTVNIGTAGVSGSTTNINIGSAVSGATTNIVLNGIPTAATAAAGTNTTQVATTAFVQSEIAGFNAGPNYSSIFLLMGA